MPSATDQLMIMYGILLQHIFLCCSSCVQWVMQFLIWPMYGKHLTARESNTAYFIRQIFWNSFFEWRSLTWHFATLTPCAWQFFNKVLWRHNQGMVGFLNTISLRIYCRVLTVSLIMPLVLWHCWLGGRKGIRPVKKSAGVLAWLSVWSKVQTCI